MVAVVSPAGHPAAYDVLVGVHVLFSVVGFGAVAMSGIYGGMARREAAGAEGETPEEVRRFFAASTWMEHLLLVAPVFGVAAMAVRPGGSEFGHTWAVAGMVIWVLAATLLLAVVRPAERAIRAAGADGAAAAPAGQRLLAASAVSDLLFVAALLMMVTQPA